MKGLNTKGTKKAPRGTKKSKKERMLFLVPLVFLVLKLFLAVRSFRQGGAGPGQERPGPGHGRFRRLLGREGGG